MSLRFLLGNFFEDFIYQVKLYSWREVISEVLLPWRGMKLDVGKSYYRCLLWFQNDLIMFFPHNWEGSKVNKDAGFFSSIKKRKIIIFWAFWNVLRLPHYFQAYCTIISAVLAEATEERHRLIRSFSSTSCHSRRGPRCLRVLPQGKVALHLLGCMCLRHNRECQRAGQ